MKNNYGWGGFANVIAAIVSHIPCCGSKIIATVFGLQLLGTFATAYFYQIQIALPIVAGIILTLIYIPFALKHQREHAGHAHTHISFRADMFQFFVVNLLIGYGVVAALYLFVPPHDHHLITGAANGYVDKDTQTVVVTVPDDQRYWPWHNRYFIARLNAKLDSSKTETTLIAKELPWYRLIWGMAAHDFALQGTVPMRIYSRLNGYAVLAALSAKPISDNVFAQAPVKYYLVVPTAAVKQ